MTNPQDNPGTPPPPSPSNSSTPSPPSTPPKPRLHRVKMLARKTLASGALSKKLNEKLKASQAQNSSSISDSKSYQSTTEGEGPRSSNSEKTQESPSKAISSENIESRFILVGSVKDVKVPGSQRSGGKKNFEKEKEREGVCGDERGNGKGAVLAVCGVAQERVEKSGMKSRGNGSGEATEGLVHLSTQRDELISSTEETLPDLLKKVGASYDPKKCRTPTTKAPNVPKPSKKRKASSPTPTASSMPRGRATRSRVKQSEVDLQRALKESKKKKMDKGKGKIAESSEAVEEEDMELVHQERDDDWSGEEEVNDSEKEHDKLAMFGKRKILKGRMLKDLVEPGMMRLVDALAAQGWKDMVLQMDGRLARNELIEFMANVAVKDSIVSSLVKGVQVQLCKETGRDPRHTL
ncbi:actin cytoskeleton-regulatory complex protein PAN1-like [Nicotiana sylvestris]|uniref:actin cytoskeleton-regulatory complex protein PAN1-like n=1 Tax=Nicotiana sylvestris TaxID=4096 RepID=UPI00388CCD0C